MLQSVLITLLFLSQLTGLVSQKDFSTLEPFFNQDEVLGLKVKTESTCSCKKTSEPKKISESLGIHTTAKAALVVDQASGKVLFQKEIERQLPIASITKLMTALVFLDHNPGFEKTVQVGRGENSLEGAKLYVKDGEEVRLEDLFYSSLVGSANNATQALVHATSLTGENFVGAMNEKAVSLGMKKTYFVEPTGLNEKNVSTAGDLAKLAKAAFNVPKIKEATTLKEYSFTTISSKKLHHLESPDELLNSYLNLTGAKTGFTNEAGNCMVVEASNQEDQKIVAVVLGSDSSNDRFQEIKGLITWAFENYQWSN